MKNSEEQTFLILSYELKFYSVMVGRTMPHSAWVSDGAPAPATVVAFWWI